MVALSVWTVVMYPLQLPIWGLLLSILVAAVFLMYDHLSGLKLAVTYALLDLAGSLRESLELRLG